MGERVHKSLLNAEVNLLFYFLSLFLTFFSRKIFLDNLGAEFIGLTGTLQNILGYLNLSVRRSMVPETRRTSCCRVPT